MDGVPMTSEGRRGFGRGETWAWTLVAGAGAGEPKQPDYFFVFATPDRQKPVGCQEHTFIIGWAQYKQGLQDIIEYSIGQIIDPHTDTDWLTSL